MNNRNEEFIAHVRERDRAIQSVKEHLMEVSQFARLFASRCGLAEAGELIGLLHDLGKYSMAFQRYIRCGSGMLGDEGIAEAERDKGKIDHATAGAQVIWRHFSGEKGVSSFIAQLLAGSVAAHHNKLCLLDFVSLDGFTPFAKRASKSDQMSHVTEVLSRADSDVLQRMRDLLASPELVRQCRDRLRSIYLKQDTDIKRQFHFGMLGRFIFSCLIDADRLSTANFEKPKAAAFRTTGNDVKWESLVESLEARLKRFVTQNRVDEIRCSVSKACFEAAARPKGIYTLTVPTGGGKTLASLRFALNHALKHSSPDGDARIERIIYVIPYTTIIDQNAAEVRSILGDHHVLEHHSNLVPDKDTWRTRVLSENWDAPVVFTTSVQFLNALFASSTNNARRMHQLANSVIIFDEIQCLPIKVVHLFNNGLNFLVQNCGTSAVLCTATQPTLDKVDSAKGAVSLMPDGEIIPNVQGLFDELRRTCVQDHRKSGGWEVEEVVGLVREQIELAGSVLIVVNTKKAALLLFESLRSGIESPVYHLSTNMCPAHRKKIIATIKESLKPGDTRRLVCVSTQLIEAGVDIDFGCVVRYLAGLDSIAQAAGRCNRNGMRSATPAPVFVINPREENTDSLTDIQHGQEVTRRILDDFKQAPSSFDNDLIGPAGIRQFYDYYFFRRSDEMGYQVKAKDNPKAECDFELLDLLAENNQGAASFTRISADNKPPLFPMRQAFATACEAFQVIDAPTMGIVVPYGKEGSDIIGKLASAFSSDDVPLADQISLLRQAQQYSVNVFPHVRDALTKSGSIREVQVDSGIYCLDERHYHEELGVTIEATMKLSFLNL